VPAVLRQVAARLRDTFASVPPTREAGPAAAAFGMRLVTQPPRRAVTAAAALGREGRRREARRYLSNGRQSANSPSIVHILPAARPCDPDRLRPRRDRASCGTRLPGVALRRAGPPGRTGGQRAAGGSWLRCGPHPWIVSADS